MQVSWRPMRYTRRALLWSVSSALLAACSGQRETQVSPTAFPQETPTARVGEVGPSPTPESTATATPVGTMQRSVKHVKISTQLLTASATLYIGIERGYFADEGLEVELVTQGTLGDAIPFLASGEIAAGGGALSSGIFNAVAQGIPLKIVACRTAVMPGNVFHGLLASHIHEGSIARIRDLHGKRIGNTNTEGLVAFENQKLLESDGLSLNDVELVRIPPQDMPIALDNGAVEAVLAVEPYVTVALDMGAGYKIVDDEEFMAALGGFWPIGFFVYGPAFTDDRELGVAFMRVHLRAAQDYNEMLKSSDGLEELIDIVNKYLPVENRDLVRKMAWPGTPIDGRFPEGFVGELFQFLRSRGEVQSDMDVGSVVDVTFIDDALASM